MPISSRSKDAIHKVFDNVLVNNVRRLRRALYMLREAGVADDDNEHISRLRDEMDAMERELQRREIEVSAPNRPVEPLGANAKPMSG